MPAVNYNFIIEQGSDFEINFQYNDENNNPVDLRDSCIVIQMIPSTPVLAATSFSSSNLGDDYELTASDKGLITLKLKNSLTKLYTFDSAIYDLDIINNGKITKLVSGAITIQKRLTPFPNCAVQSIPNTDSNNSNNPNTNAPPVQDAQDLCLKTDCLDVDIYSIVYNGSQLLVSDLSTVSGFIVTTDTRLIENVELVVNNLNYNNPQDLQILLAPPSGNKILLAGNQKITQNSGNFNFMFSNKAAPTAYLHNIKNGDLCNIYNKTDVIKYSNENLLSGFNHLFNQSVTGVWNLILKDTDPLGSGSIGGWKLLITYQPI